ncbi:MAG: ribosome hibernation-promoting factor, HPF/YfiA family [Candidatus Saccharimonadia bacterium]
MIQLQISGNNYELNDNIVDYVETKIGELEKYLPRSVRDGVRATVTLITDQSGREDNQSICEVAILVKGSKLQAREATINMFAAVDIVEQKLKSQILKYKQKTSPRQNRAKIFVSKIMGRAAEE